MNSTQIGNVPVRFVDKESSLHELASHLLTVDEFAFDTEFDRFRHAYGFTLYLLQIFDGQVCYLIDPIRLKDLSPLFHAFEDPAILKVLYSGNEDIDLLKRYGCFPRNIFDVQIASRICNHEAVSFGKLVAVEYGLELDKSEQTSNWLQRPLTTSQQAYASNDVIPLLDLKNKFLDAVSEIGRMDILEEENRLCEEASSSDFFPRLSARQKATYSEYHQGVLLELIVVRDRRASEMNLPPFKIVGDEMLEEVVKNPKAFLQNPFARAFSRRALEQPRFREEILSVVRKIRTDLPWELVRERRPESEIAEIRREKAAYENLFKPLKEQVVKTYGKISGDFFMVGARDVICSSPVDLTLLKNYQRRMVEEAVKALNLRLPVA